MNKKHISFLMVSLLVLGSCAMARAYESTDSISSFDRYQKFQLPQKDLEIIFKLESPITENDIEAFIETLPMQAKGADLDSIVSKTGWSYQRCYYVNLKVFAALEQFHAARPINRDQAFDMIMPTADEFEVLDRNRDRIDKAIAALDLR